MTEYLMAISIGPVQGFIAAARRTRDFWMGSTILSELSKTAARHIYENQGSDLQRLIFPAPQNENDLDSWQFSSDGDAPLNEFNATNVILCRVATDDPSVFARRVEDAIADHWDRVFVAETLRRKPKQSRPGNQLSVADDLDAVTLTVQRALRHDSFEFFAAWVPWTEPGYAEARRTVMRLLGGRKTVRDFEYWKGAPGKPKSSLDGARETVLKAPEERLLSLRIREGEHLDLIGLVKRLDFGKDALRFPSVSRLAADPWIRGLRRPGPSAMLQQIQAHCERLDDLRALRQRRDHPGQEIEDDLRKFRLWSTFPFEGTPLFINRHQGDIVRQHPDYFPENSKRPPTEEQEKRWKDLKPRIDKELKDIVKLLEKLRKDGYKEPSPYFAILAADGDRVGRTLSILADFGNPDLHRVFSAAQTRFAQKVRRLINNEFHGATVYAGADDVLAFLPLDECLPCAEKLHELYTSTLREKLATRFPEALRRLESEGLLTLSVGISIGHSMEPLEDLLQHARDAEKLAKVPAGDARGQQERNGLAVVIRARGGAPVAVRDNWNQGMHNRLNQWIELHRQKLIPTKAAYDLRTLARSYERPWAYSLAQSEALRADMLRVLGRKRGRTPAGPEALGRIQERIADINTAADLLALANELIVGQWVAEALDLSNPPDKSNPQQEAQ